jgi:RNA polymerase sigma factor (sigma-70 family)
MVSNDDAVRRRSEERAVAAYLAGDMSVHTRVRGWIEGTVRARAYGFTPEEQQDIAQDASVHVWRAITAPDFVLRRGLTAFVRQIARRRCIEAIRNRRDRPRHVSLDDVTLEDPARGPDDAMIARDERRRVQRAIRSLDAYCREIFAQYFAGASFDEIARRLGKTPAAVRNKKYNCLKEIQRQVAGGSRKGRRP